MVGFEILTLVDFKSFLDGTKGQLKYGAYQFFQNNNYIYDLVNKK